MLNLYYSIKGTKVIYLEIDVQNIYKSRSNKIFEDTEFIKHWNMLCLQTNDYNSTIYIRNASLQRILRIRKNSS